MHDVLEGEARSQIAYIVTHLVDHIGIRLETINNLIANFAIGNSDRSNHPSAFPATILSEGKISQKASQCWFLVRFMPLILHTHVPENDLPWQQFLHFVRLCQELYSISFTHNDLHRLRQLIERFDDFKFHQFISQFQAS
jgi:hypothetical protein